MGRRPNTEVRRQQIIDALQAEMTETGFSRTSTKAIAERAGLAAGLVHYHFKDKEAILLALVERLIAQADARHAALSAGIHGPREKLLCYVDARVGEGAGAEVAQVSIWVSLIADAMAIPSVRERLSAWLAGDHQYLSALFREAGAAASPAHAALLIAAVLGSFSLHALAVQGVPKGYAAPQLRAWIQSMLAGRD